MNLAMARRLPTVQFLTGLWLMLAPVPIVHAADDLSTMLRLVPAEGETTLVIADLTGMETALAAWHPLLGGAGVGADSIAALRRLLPFGEWANLSAPLAFRPPPAGTADKAVYWLHIPQFREKIAAMPNASEEEGVWRATDVAGVTWFAKPAGEVVILSASRINVETAGAPTRTLADEYEAHKEMLATRHLLLHMKSEAYAARLGAALDAWSGRLGTPDPNAAAKPFSAPAVEAARQWRTVVDQTRTAGLLFTVNADAIDATVIFTFRGGAVQDYLKKSESRAACERPEIRVPNVTFGAAWCEPAPTAPFLGPWLNRRIDALDAPLKSVLADLRGGSLAIASHQGSVSATVTLSGGDVRGAKERLTQVDDSTDVVRRFLDAFRGTTGDASTDRRYESMVPFFPPDAVFAVREGAGTLTLQLGSPPGADPPPTPADSREDKRTREAISHLPAPAQLLLLVDPARAWPLLGKLRGEQVQPSDPPPGPLAGVGVSLHPESIRIDVHVPKESLERMREATTPSGPT